MGTLNLYVVYNFDTDTWVNFKLFSSDLNSVPFYLIATFTGIAFCIIGTLKAIAIKENIIKSVLEALTVGSIAAVVAYSVSYYLKYYLLVGV